MITVRLTAIGDSLGVVLPRQVLERLRVAEGDLLQLIDTPNGVELSALDAEFAEQAAIAEQVMRSDCDVLKRLGE